MDLKSLRRVLLQPRPTGRQESLVGMERLSAVAQIISGTEKFVRREQLDPGGYADWSSQRGLRSDLHPKHFALVDLMSGKRTLLSLQAGRLVAATVLVSKIRSNPLRLASNAFLTAETFVSGIIWSMGGDGSDQASLVASTTGAIARLHPQRSEVADAALWTASLQTVMSYALSGYAKLPGSTWRDGSAVAGLISTQAHGNLRLWRILEPYPWLMRGATYGTLAIECLFPLVYWRGGQVSRPLILAITTMHVGISQVIGLPRFIPAFLSLHRPLEFTISPRLQDGEPALSNLVPKTSAAMALSVLAYGHLRRRRSRSQLDSTRSTDNIFVLANGETISYKWTEGPSPTAPIFVLDGGMGTSRSAWAQIGSALSRRGHVVVYDRLCRGGSTQDPSEVASYSELAERTTELVRHVSQGRAVFHVGFQIGAYVGALASSGDADLFEGLIQIEPTLTGDIADDAGIGSQLDENIFSVRSGGRQLALGVGWMTGNARPSFPGHQLGDSGFSSSEGFDERVDARIWKAALRELELIAVGTPSSVQSNSAPTLTIRAGQALVEPDLRDSAHDTIVAAAEATIPGTRLNLLTAPSHLDIVRLVDAFSTEILTEAPKLGAEL